MVAVGVLEGMLAILVERVVGVLVVVVVEPVQDVSKARQKRSILTHIALLRCKNMWYPS
jgi:hypothetical protein